MPPIQGTGLCESHGRVRTPAATGSFGVGVLLDAPNSWRRALAAATWKFALFTMMSHSTIRRARLFVLALIELMLLPTPWRMSIRWASGSTGTRRLAIPRPPSDEPTAVADGSEIRDIAESDATLDAMESGFSSVSTSVASVRGLFDLDETPASTHGSPARGRDTKTRRPDSDLQAWLLHEAASLAEA